MKYEYMKESEQMLQYFQFPKFLLKLRISQTAKFLYMILYDRARISRKNSWIFVLEKAELTLISMLSKTKKVITTPPPVLCSVVSFKLFYITE